MTLGDRIKQGRSEQFVGRQEELDLFRRIVDGQVAYICLLHVHGPAGVGKTTLLREYQQRNGDVPTVWLDGRELPPTTEAVLAAYEPAPERHVLIVDEFDALRPIEGWFRDTFIPGLPSSAVVVTAGRRALSSRWMSDPAWRRLAWSLQLQNLEEQEQRQLLALNNVPAERHEAVMRLTRGHPLALSLVLANLEQGGSGRLELDAFPDVIRSLLERFVENVPSEGHRQALEASSIAQVMTEGLLSHLLNMDQAHELFEWLHGLSFMEAGSRGVYPKDLAREALAAELRWRNPDWHSVLHDRARRYYGQHLERTRGDANLALIGDYIYLHRDNPSVKPFFEWNSDSGAYADVFRESDRAALIAMTERHEGAESATILDRWISAQPDNILVLRAGDKARGFLLKLEIQNLSEADAACDPGVTAAAKHLADHAPLRKGEVAIVFRFWMDCEAHQQVSVSQSMLFVAIVQCSLKQPNLAHTFICCTDPEFWLPMFSYGALMRLAHADFEVGGARYGMFGHDWRVLTPRAWLDLLSERETSQTAEDTEPSKRGGAVLLSREGFDAAVLDALKHFNNGPKLGGSPLLRSRLITGQAAATAGQGERIEVLRQSIRAEAESWNVSGRDAKLYDALEHGYIRPASTQERAAERLDVSIATFRRHLQASVKRLCDGLWDVEIAESSRRG